MGATMHAGDKKLWTRSNCSLVSDWCWDHEGKEHHDKMGDYDMMGVYEHTPEAVRAADSKVPWDYTQAKEQGFCEGGGSRRPIDVDIFVRARQFLHDAAEIGDGVSGGY